MIARYLLDTNVLSEISKPAPNAGVVKRFRRHELHVVTHYEQSLYPASLA